MADLDDFFSKRDKKKKSKKEEKFVVDDIAKILDAKTKERKNLETNKSTYQVPASDETVSEYKAQEADDEWKEMKDDKPDYTGLKIQELVLDDEEEEESKETVPEEDGVKEGPWKKYPKDKDTVKEKENVVEPEIVEKIQEPETPKVEEVAEKKEEVPSETQEGGVELKKYIPPHMKHKEASSTTTVDTQSASAPLTSSSSGAYVPPSKRGLSGPSSVKPRKPTTTPKINDEELFPSLEQAVGKS